MYLPHRPMFMAHGLMRPILPLRTVLSPISWKDFPWDWGVVLLSKISGQNLRLSEIRSQMTSSNSQFFSLIYLEGETSLLFIKKCTWPAMCCWAWGERRGNEWMAHLPIMICYNNMQGYFTLKQVSPMIKQTNQPTTHCSSVQIFLLQYPLPSKPYRFPVFNSHWPVSGPPGPSAAVLATNLPYHPWPTVTSPSVPSC